MKGEDLRAVLESCKQEDPLALATIIVPTGSVREFVLGLVRDEKLANVHVRTPDDACAHLIETAGLQIAILDESGVLGLLYGILLNEEGYSHHEAWELAQACVFHRKGIDEQVDRAGMRAVERLHVLCRDQERVDTCIAYEKASLFLATHMDDGKAAEFLHSAFGTVVLWGISLYTDPQSSVFLDSIRHASDTTVEVVQDTWCSEHPPATGGNLASLAALNLDQELRSVLVAVSTWVGDHDRERIIVAYPDSSPYQDALKAHFDARQIPYSDLRGNAAGRRLPASLLGMWMLTTKVKRAGFEKILDVVHWIVQDDMSREDCASLAWSYGARGTWQSWFTAMDHGKDTARGKAQQHLQRLHEAVSLLPQDAGSQDVDASRWITQCQDAWISTICPVAEARGIPLPLALRRTVERMFEACIGVVAGIPHVAVHEIARHAGALLESSRYRNADNGVVVLAPYSIVPVLPASHVVLVGMSESYSCMEDLRGGAVLAGGQLLLTVPAEVRKCLVTFPIWDDNGRPGFPHPLLVRSIGSRTGGVVEGEQLRSSRFPGIHDLGGPTVGCELEGWDEYLAIRLEAERHEGTRRLRDALLLDEDLPFARRADRDRAQWSHTVTPFDGNCAGKTIELAHYWQHVLDEAPISSQGIESWATCPQQYFLRYVLHVPTDRTRDEWQWSLEATLRGSIAHRVLEKWFSREHAKSEHIPASTVREEISALVLGVLAEDEFRSAGTDTIQREILIGDLTAHITRMLLIWSRNDGEWDVLACEQEFGRMSSQSSWEAVAIPLDEGSVLRIQGVIDRVDVRHKGATQDIRIVDYKTGKRDRFSQLLNDPLDGGRHVQGVLYAHAADAHMRQTGRKVHGLESWYLFVDGGWRDEPIGFPITEDLLQRFTVTVQGIARAIRSGNFVMTPGKETKDQASQTTWESCRYCPFDGICPANRDERVARKMGAHQYIQVVRLTGHPGDASDD